MKRLLLETSLSKIYILVIVLISILLIGGYFSYALFTVSKEKSNAISIVTGNLTYELLVDGTKGTTLSVPGNTTKEFTITLNNPNNRTARFNFYYVGSLASNVTAGYKTGDGINTPPEAKGINLEKSGTSGSSNTYKIKVSNNTSSSKTINLGVQVGLDYNDLSLPSNGHLFSEAPKETVADYVLADPGPNGDTYDDGVDTFITGEDPNNYIWYSGKLWRAVSVNNEAKTTKLVTQWNISTINYNPSNQTNFEGSYMEDWLNDTTVDGFLGNLRDYEKFIVTDAVWDATMDPNELGSITRPNGEATVTAPVGLLNMYEYQSSYHETTYSNGYLNNGLYWWTLTPYSTFYVRFVLHNGNANYDNPTRASGVRPSINLKSNVKIVDGDGTIDNPYRLNGDNDTNLSGTLLNTRYSGEYIRFGNNENNLYRIVSHEMDGQTKITSEKPLKEKGAFKITDYGMNSTAFYNSMGSRIGAVLVGDLSTYLDNEYIEMIVDSNDWYLGTVGDGVSYKLAKYTDENMSNLVEVYSDQRLKVGLLRYGELMAGQFDRYGNNTTYWTLTPYDQQDLNVIIVYGTAVNQSSTHHSGVKPSMNLKSNVVITGGTGTKSDPFTLSVQ